MKSTFSNVLYKAFQSLLGFSLLALQSRFLIQEDLAIFAIAQSLFTIVSLLDFGLGVNLTTWIVRFLDENSVTNQDRKFVSRALMIRKVNKLFTTGVVQSIFFGAVFFFLANSLTGERNIATACLFAGSVFLHSVGLNFGRVFLTTGDIAQLVKLQLFGAIIAFSATTLGLNSIFNLNISIVAMSFSSVFLGICSLQLSRKNRKFSKLDLSKFKWPSVKKEAENMTYIQIGQFLQISLPLVVQFILVSSFSSVAIIVYAVCQKIIFSIGNIFGSDIQLNYSAQGIARRIEFNDIAKFNRNYAGYLISSCLVLIVIWIVWEFLYPSIGQPPFITLLSFIPLGLLVLIDQALRYRLYFFSKFRLEMIGSLIYVVLFVLMFHVASNPTIPLLNLFLILPYIPKWFFVFASRNVL
jgi:hypothetical protein